MAAERAATVNLVVAGAAGRMGSRVVACLREAPDLALAAALEAAGHPAAGRDAGEAAGVGVLGVPLTTDAAAAIVRDRVLVEFSAPEPTLEHLRRAAEAGDGTAVRKLAEEHLSPGGGTRAIPYDRIRGIAYARLLLRVADPDWRERLNRELFNAARVEPAEVAKADALVPTLLPPAAVARLQGWSPARDFAESGYGCGG